MRLLLDEMIPAVVARQLRGRGLAMQYQNASRSHHGVVLLNQRRFPQRSSSVGALVESIEALARRTSASVSVVEWLQ